MIDEAWIEKIKMMQPELRDEKLARYKKEYEIPEYDARIITESKHMADIFEKLRLSAKIPKKYQTG